MNTIIRSSLKTTPTHKTNVDSSPTLTTSGDVSGRHVAENFTPSSTQEPLLTKLELKAAHKAGRNTAIAENIEDIGNSSLVSGLAGTLVGLMASAVLLPIGLGFVAAVAAATILGGVAGRESAISPDATKNEKELLKQFAKQSESDSLAWLFQEHPKVAGQLAK